MATLASIVHTVDPYVIRFTEGFGIRWYGLAYVTGFLLGWLILRWFARTGRTPLSVERVGDFVTALIVGVLVGGRLGHVLFYDPALLFDVHGSFPFWGLVEIHRGGMSSHGGVVGVIVACVWCGPRFGVPRLHLTDLAAFIAPIGLGVGRLANWINGELPGKPLPAPMQADPPWWSVKYPEEVFDRNFWATDAAAKFDALSGFARSGKELPRTLYDACYAGDAKVIEALAPFLTAHYPINFMQAATDGAILFGVLVVAWLAPRPAGFISGAFLATYGVLRIITEQYRTPDPDIFTVGPVTLPMTLSAAMIAAGAVLMIAAVRRRVPRFGGLLRTA